MCLIFNFFQNAKKKQEEKTYITLAGTVRTAVVYILLLKRSLNLCPEWLSVVKNAEYCIHRALLFCGECLGAVGVVLSCSIECPGDDFL